MVARTLELLQHMPIERVLIMWLNYHLTVAHKAGRNPRGRFVSNLKSDLKDGQVLLLVLQQIASKKAPPDSIDPLECAERVVKTAASLDPPVAPFITPGHLADGNEPLLHALTAELFVTHPSLRPRGTEFQAMHDVLARVIVSWDAVTPALSVLGAGDAVPAEADLDAGLWQSGSDLMSSPALSVRAAGERAAAVSDGGKHEEAATSPPRAVKRHDHNKSYEGLLNCVDHDGTSGLRLEVSAEMRAQAERELCHFDFSALGVGAKEDLMQLQMALPLIERCVVCVPAMANPVPNASMSVHRRLQLRGIGRAGRACRARFVGVEYPRTSRVPRDHATGHHARLENVLLQGSEAARASGTRVWTYCRPRHPSSCTHSARRCSRQQILWSWRTSTTSKNLG